MTAIYKSDAGRRAVLARYDAALDRWPVPHERRVVPTSQGDTFVIACGDEAARPLVLFHGSGANSAMWMRDVADWSRHHRVYAVDMIGEPGRSAESRPSMRSDAYVAWLDELWNALGIESASIVGISLGGWLALEFAVKRPLRVRSLSLLSPSGVGSQNTSTLLKAALLLALGSWGRQQAFRLVTGVDEVPGELMEGLVLRFKHFRPRMEALPVRTDEELASLAMPVQVVVGGADTLIQSAETRDRMRGRVPRLELTYLDRVGHVLPPQTAVVSEFLLRL